MNITDKVTLRVLEEELGIKAIGTGEVFGFTVNSKKFGLVSLCREYGKNAVSTLSPFSDELNAYIEEQRKIQLEDDLREV